MKKRTLTPEQEAQKQARKERFSELCKKIKAMGDGEKAKWLQEAGAVYTVEGHALSPRNTILCYFQKPGITIVGGFKQWLAKGRCVRKGEHGISILVPCSHKQTNDSTGTEETSDTFFVCGTVFDVGQTDELEAAHHETINDNQLVMAV
jgi:hypothetical protein